MDADQRKYDRIIRYVSDTPWAMHPAALSVILQVLAERRAGHRPDATELRRRIGGRERRAAAAPSGVAVIPILGAIIPRADLFTEISGGATIESITASFRAAVDSGDISAIVLEIDSPGGSVDMVPELASEIVAARGTKPVIAVASTIAASAAYWIGTAADELYVSPSGQVGSIGVWSMHDDISKWLENDGQKITLVYAGDYKVEGNSFEPLTEEARAEIQREVDAYYAMFLQAVADQRDVSVATVEEQFGQGRMVMATDAVGRGMADGVATLDQTIARLAGGTRKARPRMATTVRRGPEARARITGEPERRQFPTRFELRRGGEGGTDVIRGTATVFDTWYTVWDEHGPYEELVESGAADKTLKDGADVRFFYNHEGMVLARTKPGTLSVWADAEALNYEASVDHRSTAANDLLIAVERGDVDQSSMQFEVTRQQWSTDFSQRRIKELKLYDASAVPFAANESTEAALATDLIDTVARMDPRFAFAELRSGQPLTEEHRDLVAAAVARLQAALDPASSLLDLDALHELVQRDGHGNLDVEDALRRIRFAQVRGRLVG